LAGGANGNRRWLWGSIIPEGIKSIAFLQIKPFFNSFEIEMESYSVSLQKFPTRMGASAVL